MIRNSEGLVRFIGEKLSFWHLSLQPITFFLFSPLQTNHIPTACRKASKFHQTDLHFKKDTLYLCRTAKKSSPLCNLNIHANHRPEVLLYRVEKIHINAAPSRVTDMLC